MGEMGFGFLGKDVDLFWVGFRNVGFYSSSGIIVFFEVLLLWVSFYGEVFLFVYKKN